jgi:hypothetical protein
MKVHAKTPNSATDTDAVDGPDTDIDIMLETRRSISETLRVGARDELRLGVEKCIVDV